MHNEGGIVSLSNIISEKMHAITDMSLIEILLKFNDELAEEDEYRPVNFECAVCEPVLWVADLYYTKRMRRLRKFIDKTLYFTLCRS